MSIWLVEPSGHSTLFPILERFFAVRRIRSGLSASRLVQMEKENPPKAIIVQNFTEYRYLKKSTEEKAPLLVFVGFEKPEEFGVDDCFIPLEIGNELDIGFTIKQFLGQLGHTAGSGPLGNIKLDHNRLSFSIYPDNQQVQLTLKEFRILNFLVENPNVCLSRDEIIKGVWGGVKVSARTVDSYISRLRSKMEYSGITIENRYGGGYVLM